MNPLQPTSPPTIAEQAEAAMRRLREFINRSAAQHLRQMRKEWGSSRYEATR